MSSGKLKIYLICFYLHCPFFPLPLSLLLLHHVSLLHHQVSFSMPLVLPKQRTDRFFLLLLLILTFSSFSTSVASFIGYQLHFHSFVGYQFYLLLLLPLLACLQPPLITLPIPLSAFNTFTFAAVLACFSFVACLTFASTCFPVCLIFPFCPVFFLCLVFLFVFHSKSRSPRNYWILFVVMLDFLPYFHSLN